MVNPWKEISLSDYENHMSLDSVKQLQSLNRTMKEQFNDYENNLFKRFLRLFFSARAFAIRAAIALPSLVRLSTFPEAVFFTAIVYRIYIFDI